MNDYFRLSHFWSFLLQNYFVNDVLKGHCQAAENNLNDLYLAKSNFQIILLHFF